jgi:hypothetical protein
MADQLGLEYPKTENTMATALMTRQTKPGEYTPLPSVWTREDADLIERLLQFYPRHDPKRILDATVNGSRFWRGTKRKILGLDIEASYKPSVIADNTQMPFKGDFFDVVVYDPPHILGLSP